MTEASLNIPNLDRLIAHLEGLPEEKFSMANYCTINGSAVHPDDIRGEVLSGCGTAACIAGWIYEIDLSIKAWPQKAAEWLGINHAEMFALFQPEGFDQAHQYPLSRAIRTLKHMRSEFLRAGQVVVDWDAPEPEPLSEWAAPKAVELKADLPAEITRFLGSPSHVEAL